MANKFHQQTYLGRFKKNYKRNSAKYAKAQLELEEWLNSRPLFMLNRKTRRRYDK
ncbi:hypothetical protein [Megamonas funiformis]|jgi:hypothetical protein|uniref:hypothetical protein n=1 Tax=Megamonas funiformis TaxID=437897 RepID=UPI0040297C58